MSMMRFRALFPELAERETRCAIIRQRRSPADPLYLPLDEYGFDELYCTEKDCDCRRVMVNVLARHAQAHVATINHAFEPPAADDVVPEQTFLDPLNRQSRWAPALLELFLYLLADEEYSRRLLRHYRMFKDAITDPAHPCQRILRPSNKPKP